MKTTTKQSEAPSDEAEALSLAAVRKELTTGIEGLEGALCLLLPVFRSLAYANGFKGGEFSLGSHLSGGDAELLAIVQAYLTDPDLEGMQEYGFSFIAPLYRSLAFRERYEGREQRDIYDLAADRLSASPHGDAELLEQAIDRAKQAQIVLKKTLALVEQLQSQTPIF